MSVKLVRCKRALHDFPYAKDSPSCDGERKCPHVALLNIAAEGHCVHRCIYCYAKEYKNAWKKGPLKVYENIVDLVKKELENTDICPPIYISPATDAFQPVKEIIERALSITKLLIEYGVSFYHVTKSGLVKKCLEIKGFKEYPYYHLQITIETFNEEKAKVLSSASAISERMKTAEIFCNFNIPVVLRIDPIIFGFSDDRKELEDLIRWANSAGIRHVICSTGRFKKETFLQVIDRLKKTGYEKEAKEVEKSYEIEKGYLRVSLENRINFHRWMKELVKSYGMTYSVCQELSWRRGLDSEGLRTCHGVENSVIMKKENGIFKPLCVGTCIRCEEIKCGIERLKKHPLILPFKLN